MWRARPDSYANTPVGGNDLKRFGVVRVVARIETHCFGHTQKAKNGVDRASLVSAPSRRDLDGQRPVDETQGMCEFGDDLIDPFSQRGNSLGRQSPQVNGHADPFVFDPGAGKAYEGRLE